jgi:hypothetical protein
MGKAVEGAVSTIGCGIASLFDVGTTTEGDES